MKKTNKIIIIILIILIAVIGCKNTDLGNQDDPNINGNGQIDGEDVNISEEQKIMGKFLEMIKPETTAAELGLYIKENIINVNENNVEEMIQWLTIYQTETINEINEKIYKPLYLDALNESMEGVLDESKIENIKDEKVRREFQNLIDGFMTIVRYEETPVVETDWKALNKLSSYVSDDLGEVLGLYQKIQNYEYEREELDAKALLEDMIKTESILEKHTKGFINTKANEVYNLQTYALLVGPEGSHLGFFFYKDSQEYKEIIKTKDENPNTLTAEMIENLEKRDYKEMMEVYDAIDEKLKFGIKSNNYIRHKEYEEGNKKYKIFQIVMEDDEKKQNIINDTIKKDAEDYILELEDQEALAISIYSNYQDHQYLSYSGFVDYLDGNYYENQKGLNLYKVFDYTNEKHVELEDYLGVDSNELKDYLKKIKGIEINSSPAFQLSDRGIEIMIEDEEGREKYIQLSKKDLVPYLSLERLISK